MLRQLSDLYQQGRLELLSFVPLSAPQYPKLLAPYPSASSISSVSSYSSLLNKRHNGSHQTGFFAGGGGHMATHASPTPSHSLGTSYHTQGCDQLTCFDMFRSGYVLDYLPHNLSGADTGFMKGGHHILNAAGGSA